MCDELKITDLDDKLRKIFSDILVDEGEARPESDEELIARVNETALRSLINNEYLAQKHSATSTAP